MFDGEFCTKIRFNMYWKSLTYKNEYKIESNEFALFQALARCSGFSFIDNGIAAWNAIKEYLEINKIDLNISYIQKSIIYIKRIFSVIIVNNIIIKTNGGFYYESY